MSLIQEGIKRGLIKLDDEQKYITYVNQNKKRNYSNPEEQVQAETFLKLILTYGYDQKRIRLFVPVVMGSTTKEADIIVVLRYLVWFDQGGRNRLNPYLARDLID